jgi:hypothetical protein
MCDDDLEKLRRLSVEGDLGARKRLMKILRRKEFRLGLRGDMAIVAGKPTASGRLYPKDVWTKAALRYKEEMVDKGRAFGTLDDAGGISQIRLRDVSHLVTDIDVGPSGNTYVEIEVLHTPKGEELLKLLKDNLSVACYSGGFGSVDSDGKVREFRLTHTSLAPPIPGHEDRVLEFKDVTDPEDSS